MSIRQGDKVIAGHINYHPDLFDFKWADHLLNDVSWLRGDTFSWQDGSVYSAAYQHLVDDVNSSNWILVDDGVIYTRAPSLDEDTGYYAWNDGVSTTVFTHNSQRPTSGQTVMKKSFGNYSPYGTVSKSPFLTEQISGVTISYIEANDGHKIVLADQETAVLNIYTATGVAWYYIIDVTDTRFKLPRTKFAFTGLRDTVGKYIAPGLPNITGQSNVFGSNSESGALKTTITSTTGLGSNVYSVNGNIQLDASKSNAIYGNSSTVQPPANQMYLYFYIGNFTQTAIESTAGLNASLFDDKADVNLLNAANNVDFVVESQMPSASNNYTWYRIYRSGWVEQGGSANFSTASTTVYTVDLPVTMADDNYTVIGTPTTVNSASGGYSIGVDSRTTTQVSFRGSTSGTNIANTWNWEVKGIKAN